MFYMPYNETPTRLEMTMQKFQNLIKKTKAANDQEVSEKAIDRFYTVTTTVYKAVKIGTIVITGAAAAVAVAVTIDKVKNPQDYTDES